MELYLSTAPDVDYEASLALSLSPPGTFGKGPFDREFERHYAYPRPGSVDMIKIAPSFNPSEGVDISALIAGKGERGSGEVRIGFR